jgi:hypothetical protein
MAIGITYRQSIGCARTVRLSSRRYTQFDSIGEGMYNL